MRRIGTVLARFGITAQKFENMLKRYDAVTGDLGCVPTFPVTAVVLKRHPRIIRELSKRSVEFAVHGYVHVDYSEIHQEGQLRDFAQAIETFTSCGVPFVGYRAPFLRINAGTTKALGRLEFSYDSSYVLHWDVIDETKYGKKSRLNYNQLLGFYRSRKAQDYLALPSLVNGLVELPVSFPDDEGMVERLGVKDTREVGRIWMAMLQQIYEEGEFFVLQLHPERILLCEDALKHILQQAKRFNPPVWVAALREIAEWWKERARFTFEVESQRNGIYKVQANCSERATILVRNCRVDVPVSEWTNGYKNIGARNFVLGSQRRPFIGVSPDSSPAAISFLQSEGFVVERSDQPDNYGIYFSNLVGFEEADEKPLSREIEHSDAPLLRYWRWPAQAKSALSVTGDIDSITLLDFALRILENWRQSRRYKSARANGST
jgi:peptidoglycan/xylan/chitin deacetylase (PgdA/CDA1 family)